MSRSSALLAAAVGLAAAGLAAAAGADANTTADGSFQLIMLPDAKAKLGAMCIDGTPYGIYWQAGTGSGVNNWMIYFQGGGWCYNVGDCYGRSLGNLGSSKAWAQTGSMGGMLSQDCTVNPTFCNWNKVWMAYCDGNSFAGMADAPVMYNGTIPLNFRGRYNLDATFAAIAAGVMNPPTPWSAAYDIVLTGCSAGGLATYLHADYVANTYVAPSRPPPPGSNMTRNGRYFVLPISGFFLDAPNVNGEYVYTEQIKVIHYLSNATHGVNDACVAAQAPGEEYLCNMAPHVYPFIQSRIFPLQSEYDSWQSSCILTSEPVTIPNNTHANGNCSAAPGWASCAGNPETCTNAEMGPYNAFRGEMGTAVNSTGTAGKPGNGGFFTSCHTHCEAQNDGAWAGFTTAGVSMRDAVAAWYASDPSTPAVQNMHWDCQYNADSTPRGCNPSCAA